MNRNTHMKQDKLSKKEKQKVKKTTQDTIPIEAVFRDGLFLEEGGLFSKMYTFDDISFTIKPDSEQEAIMQAFEQMLSSLPSECSIKFSSVVLKADTEQQILEVAAQAYDDNLNDLREAYNDLIRNQLSKKQVTAKKVITVSVKEPDMVKAEALLVNAENVLRNMMISLETQLYPVSSEDRLELLQKINTQSRKDYNFEHANGITRLDFKKLAKQGLTFKDIIAPDFLSFKGNFFYINDIVGQSMYINGLPLKLSVKFYTELSAMPFEGVVSYYIRPKTAKEASKILKNLDVGIQTQMEAQENKGNVTKRTKAMSEEIDAWESDIGERDQKMFEFDLTVTHFAEDKRALKQQTLHLQNVADKYMGNLVPVLMQQERGFLTSLPLGHTCSNTARYITTESLSLFQPFDELNTFQEGGIYYGTNSVNGNVVVINKMKNDNYGSVVLGSTGSGKTFTTSQEMTAVILNKPTASVFVLDPEGEYCKRIEKYGGSVLKIAPQSSSGANTDQIHINACDLNIDKSHDPQSDPVAIKTEFLCGLLESMVGERATLDAEQLSIVQRCVDLMYAPYIEHLAELSQKTGQPVTIDRESCPTLQKLLDLLLEQPEPTAQRLARAMQPYVFGIYSIFAHTTNVDVDNRIICYDLSSMTGRMAGLALKVCMDDIWTRTIANRKKGLVTYIYADEAHRFFENPTSASYFEQFWRRLRKWSGVPTAITQNVSDLLINPKACQLLTQSANIMILKQAEREQIMLSELLHLQPSELKYIKRPKRGCGLIINNGFVIPFENDFPKDNPLYELFCSQDKSLQ